MKWPPKKAPGAGELTGRKLIDVPRAYHAPGFIQNGIIWRHWEREAARLFRLYWRSGDLKHFHAFGRHIDAMRSYGRDRDLPEKPSRARKEVLTLLCAYLTFSLRVSPALQKLRALPHNPPVLPEGTRQPLTKELAARFFSLLSVCDTSVIQLLREHPELPPYKTLYNWQQRVPWFGAMWKEARRAQAEFFIQQSIELAKTVTPKNAHAVRVKFDIYRFIAAKFNPEAYGEKLLPQQQSTTVNVGIAISPEHLAEIRAKLDQSRTALALEKKTPNGATTTAAKGE